MRSVIASAMIVVGTLIVFNPAPANAWIIKGDTPGSSRHISDNIEVNRNLTPRSNSDEGTLPSDLTRGSSGSENDHTRLRPTTRNDLQPIASGII